MLYGIIRLSKKKKSKPKMCFADYDGTKYVLEDKAEVESNLKILNSVWGHEFYYTLVKFGE